MSGGDRLFKPSSRGIRDPITNEKQNMRIMNPPRFPVFGGFSGKTKAFFKNALGLGKPGDVK
jgi:hypothetical protein